MSKADLRAMSAASSTVASSFSRHTAGTTGEPTHISLSRTELAQMLAVRAYCYNKHGLKLGQREARVWGRAANSLTAKIRDFLLNRKVFYPAEDGAEETVEKLVKWSPEYLYGYTSLILEAAQIAQKKGLKPRGLKAVICTAESILPAQKKFIAEVFGAPVLEEYGSTEFDVIAFECLRGHLHLVNPWLWVEEEDDTVLITDVSRKSQRIVRYQLGDSVSLAKGDCGELGSMCSIEELRGRTAQQFAYINPEQKFHAVVFGRALNTYMEQTGDCFKFTIVQVGYSEFDLYVSEPPMRGLEDLRLFLKSNLKTGLSLTDHLEIQVLVNDDGFSEGKHTYFIQKL
ncbi:CoF synthetase [Marinobacter sp.]|uniref:CoF synthetase n=1 Tax=Marinobacter sp. TaxID=50741 RepID=UPI00258F5801|nr:CoF synthetase [Marinobacter sp.]MCW9010009.1 CoF synthetase [Marinobacter sp.]